jgi:hypothetical protein
MAQCSIRMLHCKQNRTRRLRSPAKFGNQGLVLGRKAPKPSATSHGRRPAVKLDKHKPTPGTIKNKDGRMIPLVLIIAGGLCAVAYGIVTILDVMRRDAGTQRMQEIAAAIAEGAQAYLRRQYTTIGLVGVVLPSAS